MSSPFIISTIKQIVPSQKGVALITAILACVILFALAMLVISMSTSDIRVSGRIVGQKKAFNAAEAGIHRLIEQFNPDETTWTASGNIYNNRTTVSGTSDPHSFYMINTPRESDSIDTLSLPEFDIGNGRGWGLKPYDIRITGENSDYNSEVSIDIGIGYGPVPRGPGLL